MTKTAGGSVELVIFDMAGTTVQDDNVVEACFAEAAAATGLQMTADEILAVQGHSKRAVFETYWERQLGGQRNPWADRVEESFQTFREILEHHYRTQEVAPTIGCLEVFEYLRERRIKIALTTGFYRLVTDLILERLGWLDGLDDRHIGTDDSLIQMSVASDEVAAGRPAPDMIQRVIAALHVQGRQSVINVGDTPSDLESGRRARCGLSLAVTNGSHTEAQLAALPNNGLLSDLWGLIPFLERGSSPCDEGQGSLTMELASDRD
ncbi:MAG: HAD hydrolase-like protein [Gemmatimonas sp.]|nr:HAD hydrolase-like protein [Gemmatimonas sp.]